MADDFLNDILGQGSAAAEAEEADDIDDREYRAFKIGARTVECELRTVKPVEHGLPFSYTYNVIAYSGDYSYFWVVTSYFLLKVKGWKLRPIVKALRARKVAYLQEFNKAKHDTPKDETGPVITQMDIIIQPASESYKEAAAEYGPQKSAGSA